MLSLSRPPDLSLSHPLTLSPDGQGVDGGEGGAQAQARGRRGLGQGPQGDNYFLQDLKKLLKK